MITLHHLNKSRSQRIIWLLEEIGEEYNIVAYQRDATTNLAPAALKKIHPLGKSPVIEENGKVIAESGAITEYLISKYPAKKLAPSMDSEDYIDYLQWVHYAESSAILPLLLKMFVGRDGGQMNFLPDYADTEVVKVISHLNESLKGKRYLVGDKLSGADIMMSFIVQILQNTGAIAHFPNIAAYGDQLATHDGYNKAIALEAELDKTA